MQYSTAWNLNSVTGGNSTSDYCETGCIINNVTLLVNSVANTIQINNLFTRDISARESVITRYTLKNIGNPSYVLS